jgi:hypothetical protein
MQKTKEKILKTLNDIKPKRSCYFYLGIIIRLIVPIIIFRYFHPFYSILFNEIVLDGLLSPHHVIYYLVPQNLQKYSNDFYTDKPLDMWGFLFSLQPILIKSNKFYHVFQGYRSLLFNLFVYRLIGFIVFLITRNRKVFLFFPNFYLTTYIIVSFFSKFLKQIDKQVINKIIILGFILTIIKEFYIHWNPTNNKL